MSLPCFLLKDIWGSVVNEKVHSTFKKVFFILFLRFENISKQLLRLHYLISISLFKIMYVMMLCFFLSPTLCSNMQSYLIIKCIFNILTTKKLKGKKPSQSHLVFVYSSTYSFWHCQNHEVNIIFRFNSLNLQKTARKSERERN